MSKALLIVFLSLISLGQPGSGSELAVKPEVAWQGKVITVNYLSAAGVTKATGTFLGQKFNCYKTGDNWRGIIGVPIDQKAGYYNLSLIAVREDGSKDKIVKRMKVWDTRFPFSKFRLKPSRNKLRTRKIIDNEWALIDKVLRVEGQQQLWQGKFKWPVKARVSQGFGHREIINGKKAGHHRGVDLAVISGTKVFAPNYGRVVFAKRLKAFGGTMIIDHGQGIHSLYFHLSKLVGKVGQIVTKGQLIARSGNSGISSGAHLHWGMSVHNLRVDPLQWTKYEI